MCIGTKQHYEMDGYRNILNIPTRWRKKFELKTRFREHGQALKKNRKYFQTAWKRIVNLPRDLCLASCIPQYAWVPFGHIWTSPPTNPWPISKLSKNNWLRATIFNLKNVGFQRFKVEAEECLILQYITQMEQCATKTGREEDWW